MLSSNLSTSFEQETRILNPKTFSAWAVGKFEILYEFWTYLVDSELVHFSPTYEFEIDLELTQISNTTTNNQFWATRHIKMSTKCLYLIQNASYLFKTHNFWSFLKLFITFLCNKWSMRVYHMLGHLSYYISSLSFRVKEIFWEFDILWGAR